MAWADSVQRANAQFLSTWSAAAVLSPAALQGQTFPITGIIKNPPIEEELLSGGNLGAHVVRFWVNYAGLSQQPVKGDLIAINGVSYDVDYVGVDIEGGAVLHLRANA